MVRVFGYSPLKMLHIPYSAIFLVKNQADDLTQMFSWLHVID